MNIWLLHIGDFDDEQNGYPVKLFSGAPQADNLLSSGLIAAEWRPDTPKYRELVEAFESSHPDGNRLNAIAKELHSLLQPVFSGHIAEDSEDHLLLALCNDLRPLPWERMLEEDYTPLFVKGSLRCMRVRHPAEPAEAPPLSISDWPLRMLIVVGAADDDPAIKAQSEIEAITDVLIPFEPNIDYEICRQPNRESLRQVLQAHEPHIFHFIGHGRIEDGRGYLEISNSEGSWQWWAEDIRNQITNNNNKTNIRLAYINACLSSTESVLWSVSDAFLEAGVPAVIGMRDEVRGSKAVQLARVFYSALSEYPEQVARALKIARDELIAVYGLQDLEWSSPCLEVQCKPSAILDVCIGVDKALACGVKATLGSRVRELVGRRKDARKATTPAQILVVLGEREVGKTSLVTMLLEQLVLKGKEVHYVDPDEGEDQPRKDLSQLLELTINGAANPDDAFIMITEPFDLSLVENEVKARYEKALDSHRENPTDTARVNELATAFAQLILQAKKRKPVVLVYDHMRGMLKHELKHAVWPFLSVLRTFDDIQVVIILDETEKAYLLPTENPHVLQYKHGVSLIKVDHLDEDQFNKLMIEFLYRLHIVDDKLDTYRSRADDLKSFIKKIYVPSKENRSWKERFIGLKVFYQSIRG